MSDNEELLDFEFTLKENEVGERIDVIVTNFLREQCAADAALPDAHQLVPTRSKVARWIEQGYVRVNLESVGKSFRPEAGAQISLTVPPPAPLSISGDPLVEFGKLYEDEAILVINKPAGLTVHPGAGQLQGTLVNGLVEHLGEKIKAVGDALRPGIVHRLDKETSGLMVVAKSDSAYHQLAKQFQPPRTISRTYLALTYAVPEPGRGATEGIIDLPIGRHPVDRVKMAVVEGGREAVTRWRVREVYSKGALLEVKLETGRTHQIRVHLAQKKAGIVGDAVYGIMPPALSPQLRAAARKLGRQALHAWRLAFLHPQTKAPMQFEAEPPEEMAEVIELFRNS